MYIVISPDTSFNGEFAGFKFKNGNCIITCNRNDLNISNKHNAIIFYKNNIPVRLMVINQHTDIDKCIGMALSQQFNDTTLNEIYTRLLIKRCDIDL